MTITKVQLVEIQTITTNVNVVDVNVTTRSKAIEKQMFKDKDLKKAKRGHPHPWKDGTQLGRVC
jgi:hypothetical protein